MAGSSTSHSWNRARVHSEPGEAAADVLPKRDAEVWFEDGNVIVVADDTAFKVHRGVLSLHSEVFRDMFALATPDFSGYSPVVTTCPVVHLSDTANEIETLLGIMYSQGNK